MGGVEEASEGVNRRYPAQRRKMVSSTLPASSLPYCLLIPVCLVSDVMGRETRCQQPAVNGEIPSSALVLTVADPLCPPPGTL